MDRKKNENAFTLVEILIVVVILGILAAIVIPEFQEGLKEAKTARDIDFENRLFESNPFKNVVGNDPERIESGKEEVRSLRVYMWDNGKWLIESSPASIDSYTSLAKEGLKQEEKEFVRKVLLTVPEFKAAVIKGKR